MNESRNEHSTNIDIKNVLVAGKKKDYVIAFQHNPIL